MGYDRVKTALCFVIVGIVLASLFIYRKAGLSNVTSCYHLDRVVYCLLERVWHGTMNGSHRKVRKVRLVACG